MYLEKIALLDLDDGYMLTCYFHDSSSVTIPIKKRVRVKEVAMAFLDLVRHMMYFVDN